MNLPLISVIVPVYNVQQYLEKCVDSLRGQSFKNIEIILINDGSTDGSGALCDALAEKDTRIRVLHQKNQGVSETRNNGIRCANGEYIVFVDSDDTVDDQYVQTLYQEIAEQDFDFVICGYRMCYPKHSKDVHVESDLCVCGVSQNEKTITQIYNQKLLNSPWNKIYKKKLISQYFDSSLAMGEDLVFNLQYLKSVKKMKVISKVLYHYIIRTNSAVTTYKPNRMSNIIKVNNHVLDFYASVFGTDSCEAMIVSKCLKEIDAVYRHLFRGKNTKAEKKALIRHWCEGEEYRAFCEKYAPTSTLFLAAPQKLYRHYNVRTWLERKILKLLR